MEKLETNLDAIKKHILQNDVDWVHAITGPEGSGKSTLAAAIGFYFDESFNSDRMKLNLDEYRSDSLDLEPGQCIVADEGIEGLYSREAMTKGNKKNIKYFRKCRYLNLLHILILPDLSEMDKSIRDNRVHSLTRVTSKGRFQSFSEQAIQKIDYNPKNKNGVKYPAADFEDTFPDVSSTHPEFWEEYNEKKAKDIEELEKEQNGEDEDKTILQCNQCGYNWEPRKDNPEDIRRCANPKCQSVDWNGSVD